LLTLSFSCVVACPSGQPPVAVSLGSLHMYRIRYTGLALVKTHHHQIFKQRTVIQGTVCLVQFTESELRLFFKRWTWRRRCRHSSYMGRSCSLVFSRPPQVRSRFQCSKHLCEMLECFSLHRVHRNCLPPLSQVPLALALTTSSSNPGPAGAPKAV